MKNELKNNKQVKDGLVFYENINTSMNCEDVLNSKESFYYLPKSDDSASVPALPSVYDSNLQYIENINAATNSNDSVYKESLNYNLYATVINRLMSTIKQNLYTIFLNGFFKNFEDYFNSPDDVLDLARREILSFDNSISISSPFILGQYCNYSGERSFDVNKDNAINIAVGITSQISESCAYIYDRIISTIIKKNLIDIGGFFDDYFKGDDQFKDSYYSLKVSFVMSALNEIGNKDIAKITDIIEINTINMISTILNHSLDIKNNIKTIPLKTIPIDMEADFNQ